MLNNEFFGKLTTKIADFNAKNGFKMQNQTKGDDGITLSTDDDNNEYVEFRGDKGVYRLLHLDNSKILCVDCAADAQSEFANIAKLYFDPENADEQSIKSTANEILDEIKTVFFKNEKKELSQVKLPRSISKSAVKNGFVSYDAVDFAVKFVDQYSELKDNAKEIQQKYGELLPETFFIEYGTPYVISTLKSGDDAKIKKLFKLLNDVYDNGTNAAQDIIAVTILGQIDESCMNVAKEHMNDYMKAPVLEVHRILSKKSSLTKKLENPPPYKPKKEKKSFMSGLAQQGGLDSQNR